MFDLLLPISEENFWGLLTALAWPEANPARALPLSGEGESPNGRPAQGVVLVTVALVRRPRNQFGLVVLLV
jgi:hypothetical protein